MPPSSSKNSLSTATATAVKTRLAVGIAIGFIAGIIGASYGFMFSSPKAPAYSPTPIATQCNNICVSAYSPNVAHTNYNSNLSSCKTECQVKNVVPVGVRPGTPQPPIHWVAPAFLCSNNQVVAAKVACPQTPNQPSDCPAGAIKLVTGACGCADGSAMTSAGCSGTPTIPVTSCINDCASASQQCAASSSGKTSAQCVAESTACITKCQTLPPVVCTPCNAPYQSCVTSGKTSAQCNTELVSCTAIKCASTPPPAKTCTDTSITVDSAGICHPKLVTNCLNLCSSIFLSCTGSSCAETYSKCKATCEPNKTCPVNQTLDLKTGSCQPIPNNPNTPCLSTCGLNLKTCVTTNTGSKSISSCTSDADTCASTCKDIPNNPGRCSDGTPIPASGVCMTPELTCGKDCFTAAKTCLYGNDSVAGRSFCTTQFAICLNKCSGTCAAGTTKGSNDGSKTGGEIACHPITCTDTCDLKSTACLKAGTHSIECMTTNTDCKRNCP